jgi:hypothetical protein
MADPQNAAPGLKTVGRCHQTLRPIGQTDLKYSVPLGLELDDLAPQLRDFELLRLHLALTRESVLRIIRESRSCKV